MSEEQQANEVQDPAEPYRVEKTIETHEGAPEEPAEVEKTTERVEETVTETPVEESDG